MGMQAQASKNVVTLRGSTTIVTEFFAYAVNSILYQRGIYPADMFSQKTQYGLSLMVTTDTALTTYLGTVLQQMSDWLMQGILQKIVLVISSVTSKEVLERWTFDIQTDNDAASGRKQVVKSEADITREIQAVIRQITASVTFLPLLSDTCTFELLAYTDADLEVPLEWEESTARLIPQAASVEMRSWATGVQKVGTEVDFKAVDAV
eukprot:jgi/Botrbrau1/16683/Bobra.0317s0001.1